MAPDAAGKSASGFSLTENNSVQSQYLTFTLGEEEYAIDILKVMELRGWEAPTVVPNYPDFVQGVINIRGVVVPIIDMRKRFCLPPTEYGPLTVVIVLRVNNEQGNTQEFGIIVDAVNEVYSIDADAFKEAPEIGHRPDRVFVKGLASVDERLIIILEGEKLVDLEAMPSSDSPL